MTHTVFATISVQPEHMEAACEAVDGITSATRDEVGCVAFEPRRAADGSSTILIFEEWLDRDAFDFHHAQAYTRDVFAKYENWLAKAPVLIETKSLRV